MKNRDFLIWVHERLHHQHGDSELVDFMHTLRRIIRTTDPECGTTGIKSCNSMDELKRDLGIKI